MVARKAGVEKTISTSVPNPQRLVPPVAPRAAAQQAPDSSWTCSSCRHVNGGNRAGCSRCCAPNQAYTRGTSSKVRCMVASSH
jgi:uncharacterized paraquat-inducible protein A